MPPRNFIGEVIKRLVFLDSPAERSPALHPRVSRIRNRTERVYRLETAVAQKSEDVAVEIV